MKCIRYSKKYTFKYYIMWEIFDYIDMYKFFSVVW